MRPIVKWQYSHLEDTLGLLEEHLSDPDCPCHSEGEACPRKHLKRAEAYAAETIAMLTRSDGHGDEIEKLAEMAEQAKIFRLVEERILCGAEAGAEETVSIGWAGTWRKYFEGLVVGTCDIEPPAPALVEDVARMFRKKAEPRWCPPVKETDEELSKLSRTLGTAKKRIAVIQRHLDMPLNICRGQAEMFESPTGVLDPYGSRCRDPKTGTWVYSEECGFEPAGITTTALGMDGMTRYEFEFKLVSFDKLIVSHDPFTFAPNPNYPKELQPRLRERAATKVQVEKIAANLEPDAVITDFHVIDRGTPIVGPDMVVEAGNGRVMGIIKAAADHPDKYSNYKDRLRERTHDYGLSPKDVDSIKNPLLIRVRITDVDRTTFTQEANQAATIAPSAIENARTDAQKITLGMLQELIVGDNESLEDALRAPKNQAFAKRFLATLPENVQAALVDAQGYLNRDGVHRMAMAVFVSAFQGDTGLRLAEKAFESIDMDVRNTVNAIARSLGAVARAEALTRTGERDSTLSIGDDLAQTVNVYSAIKRNPALTVEKYLAQEQIFARELTPFQERILVVLEDYKRSPKKLAGIFTAYAEGVISAPPPAQASLIPGVEITKEGLWESAVKAPEAQPILMEVIRMLEEKGNGKYGLIPAVKIEITRVEGLHSEVTGKPEVCTNDHLDGAWECANHVLVKWSGTAPKEGGYDKCDFKVTYKDGETYSGRYDLKHHTIEYPDLAKHIWGVTTFHAGVGKPHHLTNEQYRDYLNRAPDVISKYQHFLQTYEVGTYNAIEAAKMFENEVARMFAPMMLLTKEIRAKLPPLYSQEKVQDPMVQVKFFTPDSNWTWYATEFDGEDLFFGLVVGFEKELGYFSLKELESARGPMGLAIERDKWFKPIPLSEVKKLHQAELGDRRHYFCDWLDHHPHREIVQVLTDEEDPKCPFCKRIMTYGSFWGQAQAKAELAQGTAAAIGAAAITGVGIGAGFKFVDWVAKKFGKKEVKAGEMADDIIDRIAQRYKELEIIKKDSTDKEDISYFDGQQSGLVWVGYRIDEPRMIQAVAALMEEGIKVGEEYTPSVYLIKKFGGDAYVFYKHVSSDKEAMKLVNQLYENWRVRAIATSDNDLWIPKKDAPLLIDPEFLKRGGSMGEQEEIEAVEKALEQAEVVE